MWNVLKFFFVWFWLGVAAFVLVVLIAPHPEPRLILLHGQPMPVPSDFNAGVAGLLLGFTMSIPAYFIARPKRATS